MPITLSTGSGVMPTSADPPPYGFQDLWKSALVSYEQETGRNLLHASSFSDLSSSDSVASILRVIQSHDKAFKAFRAHGERIRSVLIPLVRIVGLFSDAVAEGASSATPGGKAIFVAFGVLLQATRGVSQTYDALGELLSKLRLFLSRVEVHLTSQSTINPALMDIFHRTLVQLLHVLALFTKYLDRSAEQPTVKQLIHRVSMRARDYIQILVGNSEVQDALKVLDDLTREEALMVAARTLAVVEQSAGHAQSIHDLQIEKDIRDWINPPDPSVNHNRQTKLKQDGTCSWFFDKSFEDWKQRDGSVYWIYGNPGAGKSVLCSSIIESIIADSNSLAAYFYFDFRDHHKQSLRGLLSSLILQLATQSSPCWEYLKNFRRTHSFRFTPSEAVLSRCLESMLIASEKTFVIVDALDECPESARDADLLPFIRKLVKLQINGLHLLFTSRPEHDIQGCFSETATHSLDLRAAIRRTSDIQRYISSELYSSSHYRDWPTRVKSRAEQLLNTGADGMFLWVNLQLQTLRRCAALDVEKTLNDLPLSLDATYERILTNLGANATSAARIRHILQCIAFARRPLSPEELGEIFTMDLDSDDAVQPMVDLRVSDPAASLVQLCPGLIQVVDTPFWWSRTTRAVQFVHASVPDYLRSGRLTTSVSSYGVDETSAHVTLSKMCLSTLISDEPLLSLPLNKYAVWEWSYHVIHPGVAEAVDSYLCRFLHPGHRSFTQWRQIKGFGYPSGNTPLALAAGLGLYGPAKALLELSDPDSSCTGSALTMALYAAAQYGHRDVALLLLERETANLSAELPDGEHHPPSALHLAIERNATDVASFLFACGASTSARDAEGWTLLHRAAGNGNTEIARLLLDNDADVDTRDSSNRTPLHIAVLQRHTDVADLLLARGADVHASSVGDWTALHIAARDGHTALVRSLLDHGADARSRGKNDWTPLYVSARNGYIDVAKVLLDHGASPEDSDNTGYTALHVAVKYHRTDITRFLLGCDIPVDIRDHSQATPLHAAASNAALDAAVALIDHGAAIDALDEYNRTPLHCVAKDGSVRFARMLLDHGAPIDLLAGSEDFPGRGETVLHVAIRMGHTELASLFIERGADVNVSTKDDDLWTPLHLAAVSGDIEILQLLLAHGAIIDARDAVGRSAHHHAAEQGHEAALRYLAENGLPDVEATDSTGWTPLHSAARYGHFEAAKALISLGASVNVHKEDGWTPMHLAAGNGHVKVIDLLCEHSGDVDPRNEDDETPLHVASNELGGSTEAVLSLIEHGASVDARGRGDRTAAHYAAQSGHEEIVRAFLQHRADDAITPEDSPLLLAASLNGHLEVVTLLLDYGADVNTCVSSGWTAIHAAASSGYADMVALLLQHGADVHARTDAGRTALVYASAGGWVDVTRDLLSEGAGANVADSEGLRAADYAAAGGHAEALRLLLQHSASGSRPSVRSIAGRACRADAVRPVTRSWRSGEAQEVMQLLENENSEARDSEDSGVLVPRTRSAASIRTGSQSLI